MPKEKKAEEKAAGKLISVIQKEWHEQVGEKAGEETEEIIGKAHYLLQARNAEKMKLLLGNLSVQQYIGDIWLQKHPNVKPYVKALEHAINENA